MPKHDGSDENNSHSIYIRTRFISSAAEKIAEEICSESPEMYSVFIDEPQEVYIKREGETRKYVISAEQRVVFSSDEEPTP